MEDVSEAGHVAKWTGSHYLVMGPSGIEIGTIEPVDGAWEWVEFKTEYEREVEMASRAVPEVSDALHAMLVHGGWLI